MMLNNRLDCNFRQADRFHDFHADFRMPLDEIKLLIGQLSLLEQHGIGNAYLADIMNERPQIDILNQTRILEIHDFHDFTGQRGDPVGMTPGNRIAKIKCRED